ncbi:uncharacterized protein LOC111383553 [Olea europaea var. sylvestris]|uniref:uncharacterized protein LOC111383553 n=1 Tax=Olea europaea var. sylvestris TaxID=158386 RepID=UPI000C1D613C|nr:uncharacterized protein LOC111383553 [Olea europaea var. sylvestris]
MKKDVRDYVANYAVCQQNKYLALSPYGLLQPLPISESIWDDISMDFIDGLPKSGGVDTVLVVVDRLSKYGHFIGLKHPFTTPEVAKLFIRERVRLHGMPRSIVSDRDRIFMSVLLRINLALGVNIYCGQSFGTTHHSTLQPNELKAQLSKAQLRMKQLADGHRRDIQFEGGDLVYLKLRPYRQKSVRKRSCEKLPPRYHGPSEVFSKLRKAIVTSQPISSLHPHLRATGNLITEPEEVLAIRTSVANMNHEPEVLIRWKDLPEFEATWKPFETIRQQFPSFHLEDKVDFGTMGNDKPPHSIHLHQKRKE